MSEPLFQPLLPLREFAGISGAPPLMDTTRISAFIFRLFSVCFCCVRVPSHKDTSQTGLGPTHFRVTPPDLITSAMTLFPISVTCRGPGCRTSTCECGGTSFNTDHSSKGFKGDHDLTYASLLDF